MPRRTTRHPEGAHDRTAEPARSAGRPLIPADRVDSNAEPDRCELRCIHPEAVAHARASLADASVYAGLAELFGALAEPRRAALVHLLAQQELCTCDLAASLGLTASGVSQHLRILRALHIVRSPRVGKFVYYRLDDAHVAQLMRLGLTHLGHVEPLAAPGVAAGTEAAVQRDELGA